MLWAKPHPQVHMLESPPPIPENMTVFGNRVSTEVIT